MNATGRALPLALHGIGIVVVVWAFLSGSFTAKHGVWLAVAAAVAVVSWAAAEVLQLRLAGGGRWDDPRLFAARRVVLVVGVVVTAYTQPLTDGVLVAPLAIVLIIAIADEREPVWLAPVLAALAFVLTPLGSIAAHDSLPGVLSYEAGNAVWILIGISRRQARVAERRIAELAAQQQATREQEARATLLADRQAAARDVHDVLAHSLGGLVIQLDAAEALLEAGRAADGLARVAQAKSLATEGFADARRAVAALRAPDEHLEPTIDMRDAMEQLLRAHRELGGAVDARFAMPDEPVSAPIATAFTRVLQEALSNTRRHAPGQPVDVDLTASGGRLRLTVANPVDEVGGPSSAGGGNGLPGMAERLAALPGGRLHADRDGGRFVVSASAMLERVRS